MSNKTISINPSIFSVGLSKTKKNRSKKERPSITPLISPNVLKNKLLKRIKEHKTRETENLDNNKKKLDNKGDNSSETNKINDDFTFTDEFNDSISYLQTLSKQKKVNDEKERYERNKQLKRTELERKTVKNYHSLNSDMPIVNIDLPEELKQPLININTEHFASGANNSSPLVLNKYNYNRDAVPYGVLKNGLKPTYRDWTRTQRSSVVTNPNSSLVIDNNVNNINNNERETRLKNLRDKLKLKQLLNEKPIEQMENSFMTQNLIQRPKVNDNPLIPIINTVAEPIIQPIVDNVINDNINNINNINLNSINNQTTNTNQSILEPMKTKRIIKKTIKRKYTLGKSQIKKTVAVLLKDRGTRKKVLTAQRDLKRKPMNDIKSYLRDHNLIKIGSNAPNDVLRKLYETSMLAGEITNSNTEILLHNLSKDDKEL